MQEIIEGSREKKVVDATEGKEGEKEGESKGKPEARTQDSPGKALRLRVELGKEEPGQAFRPLAFGLA